MNDPGYGRLVRSYNISISLTTSIYNQAFVINSYARPAEHYLTDSTPAATPATVDPPKIKVRGSGTPDALKR